jgi:signal transduction histidine kinase
MGVRGGTVPPAHWLLGALGGLAAGLVGLNWWLWLGYGRAPWGAVLSSTSASVCFVAAGMLAWRLRSRSRTGPWMAAMGLVMLIDSLNSDLRLSSLMPGRELIALIGVPAYWMHLAIGVYLFLSYPTGRVNGRIERIVVVVGFLISGVGSVLLLVTATPAPFCAGWCGRSPVQLIADLRLYLDIETALAVVLTVVAIMVLVLLGRRALHATPRQRRVLGLMIAAGALTILLLAASKLTTLAGNAGGTPEAHADVLGLAAAWAAVAGLPVAFLIGLLRERLAFASVASLVSRLEHVSADKVEAALGEVLRDPTLQVAFPAGDRLLDAAGRIYEPPRDGSRSVTPLGDPPLAMLVHAPDLAEDQEVLDAAATTARLALDNARLHAEVRAQLAEVRASRQRIAAAADAERQRLERDLHDGAQQRLLGVGLALGVLRTRVAGVEKDLLDEMEQELRAAIAELRDLAQGIRPAVLTDQGLAPALAGLARRSGLRVATDVQLNGRVDPMIEAAAYYVVSEALQNAVKHASTAKVQVSAVHQAGRLVIDVTDDGPGGASPRAGTGLRGLADRVDAAGGHFEIESPPGQGTHIRAELPCE